MQPVGSDEEVEGSGDSAFERHVYPVSIVLHRCDGVVEDVRHVVARCLVEDPGQVAPHDLDVPLGDTLTEHLGRGLHWASARTDERDYLRLRPSLLHVGEHAHPARQLDRGTQEIDGMAAGAESRLSGSLDHRRTKAEPMQPIRQHGTGHACARDEDTRPLLWHVTPVDRALAKRSASMSPARAIRGFCGGEIGRLGLE